MDLAAHAVSCRVAAVRPLSREEVARGPRRQIGRSVPNFKQGFHLPKSLQKELRAKTLPSSPLFSGIHGTIRYNPRCHGVTVEGVLHATLQQMVTPSRVRLLLAALSAVGVSASTNANPPLSYTMTFYVDEGRHSISGHVFVELSDGKNRLFRGFYPNTISRSG